MTSNASTDDALDLVQPLATALVVDAVLPQLPEALTAYLDEATDAQRRYLIARCTGSQTFARQIAGVEASTVARVWRLDTTFYAAERAAAALEGDKRLAFARGLAQGAAPLVVHRQVEQAVESHLGRTDRELMAQQRARDAVLKVAGLVRDAAPAMGDVERVDIIAARLWMRRKEPPPQTP